MAKKSDPYRALVDRLRAAFPNPAAAQPGFTADVIKAFRGCGYDAWWEFDERNGYRDVGSELFSLVRQTRNSPNYGPALFAAINEAEG
jgi:hypothetical protein